MESIDNAIQQLNQPQFEAVKKTEGPLLVVAGAGSGKTRMLTVRIAWLIDKCNVAPESILAVTFTNKAAREMRERVGNLVDSAHKVTLTTFHSFCCQLLRRWHKYAGFEKGFTIYDENDCQKLLKQTIKDCRVDNKKFSVSLVSEAISQAKNELIKPENYLENKETSSFNETLQKLYDRYQKTLDDNQAVDFDDLIFKAYYMLLDNSELLKKLQDRYKYFLVDEYQDTNYSQYKLIAMISSETGNLCVVGDEDQSIYSWRGATIRNIQDFEHDFDGAGVILLEQNYRSTQNILDAAGALIAKNLSAHPKKLWTKAGAGEALEFIRASDDRQEAQLVVQRIKQLIKTGYNLCDFAILFRMNSLSRQIEQVLHAQQIDYALTGGTRFFERREVKDIIAYLRIIDNPRDTVSLQRIISVPRRGIGTTTLSRLQENNPELSLWESIAAQGASTPNSKIGKFFRLMLDFMDAASHMKVSQLCKKIINDIDYEEYLIKDDQETAEDRINNIKALVSDIRYQEEDNDQLNLAEYLANVALYSAVDKMDSTADKIQLMTMHNAKGLEFPVVFIMGMEEGIFPHSSSGQSQQELEEERRLAYVGMTRACKKLCLTAAASRMIYGSWVRNPVSRFVTEVPSSLFNKKEARCTRPTISEISEAKAFARPSFLSANKPSRKQFDNNLKDYTGTEAGTMLNLRSGVIVAHQIFGKGVVEKTLGDKIDDFRVCIRFESAGTKTLLLQYSSLKVINNHNYQEV